MSQSETVRERAVSLGLFDGVEVGALDVLDDGELGGLTVLGFHQDDGDVREAGEARGAEAAFAADELETTIAQLAADEGLDDAVCLDGVGELAQRVLIEGLARLPGRPDNLRDGDGEDTSRETFVGWYGRLGDGRDGRTDRSLGNGLGVGDKGVQPAPKPGVFGGGLGLRGGGGFRCRFLHWGLLRDTCRSASGRAFLADRPSG